MPSPLIRRGEDVSEFFGLVQPLRRAKRKAKFHVEARKSDSRHRMNGP